MKKTKELFKIECSTNNQPKLVALIKENSPLEHHELIDEAVQFSKAKYKGHKRLSGESFFYHPLNVAAIVSQLDLDTNSVIAALLHSIPTVNVNSDVDLILEIQEKFGQDVADMVLVIHSYSKATKSNSDKEMITRYILRSSNDLRPIIIKLADRLHDARTVDALLHKEQKKIARTLIDVYGPLADYLNQYLIKKEIEEIAFRILHPTDYEAIHKKLILMEREAEKKHAQIYEFLKETASGVYSNKEPVIYGRIKGHYGVDQKLKKNNYDNVNRVLDYLAYTVLFENEEECYLYLKKIMKAADFEIEDYDDYIRKPKPNGYKGLQIPLRNKEISNLYFEVQIKTHSIHHYNIYGPASHLSYKYSKGNGSDLKYYWVKEIHKNLYDYYSSDKNDLSTPIPSQAYNNKIYVFTPEDTIVELPVGSTVIDFAYKLHSDVGNKAVGALVNGSKSDLSAMLRNGDTVKINVDESKEYPDREWLQYVRTRKARDAIETEYRKYLLENDTDFTHVL